MERSLENEVRQRAAGLCEYCHLPEAASELRHVVDHIIARQHGGETRSDNLALACARCNRYKGPNIAGLDPETNCLTRLFNPRIDRWTDHFACRGVRLTGLTGIGRTTIVVLEMNQPARIAVRNAVIGQII